MNVKTATFRGRRYGVVFADKLYGFCDQPENPGSDDDRQITISTDQTDRQLLDTTIHESLHALYPAMSEDDVTTGGTDIARFLWRLGYRKVDDE